MKQEVLNNDNDLNYSDFIFTYLLNWSPNCHFLVRIFRIYIRLLTILFCQYPATDYTSMLFGFTVTNVNLVKKNEEKKLGFPYVILVDIL